MFTFTYIIVFQMPENNKLFRFTIKTW